ncbi:zona pellucida-like domain-containing protein 1 [Engystomops pustulosus]|uniref:zona pellucida-like domain-containing protein 1 n=1 Tax=Engystomops pustulosus TaxID=76066 RepID=UPI003AFACFBA
MCLGIVLLISSCFLKACFALSCPTEYNRLPVNSDIEVVCGPTDMQLAINVCPVYYANFDPVELSLNGKHNTSACSGLMDNSTNPPVLRFTLKLDDSSSNVCGNFIEITNDVGQGFFNQYSNVQAVTISGFVDSLPLSEMGIVSYSTNLYYNFSCHYPLQYLLNNTELLTSFGSVAINNNNGSFISTLRMQIFTDENFTNETTVNGTTYELKKKIYVKVTINNTATSYYVNLDRCFATPSPIVTSVGNDSYAFFTGCDVQNRTTIIMNGKSTSAKFSFDSFRFMQHNGQKTSSIYLHCMVSLCLPENCPRCSSFRKRREANADAEPVMISSGPLYVSGEISQGSSGSGGGGSGVGSGVSSGGMSQMTRSHSGLAFGLIIAAIIGMWA